MGNHVSYGYVLGSSAHLEPRTLAAAAFFLSVSCHTGMLSFGYVIFYLGQFLKFPPYVWTIVTSFLITGEGIGIILDTYFLYTYSTHLGNVLHMHPRCSRSESNIHRCSDSGSIHPLRHASHDIGHGWSAGSEDSSHWISCRPSLRLPHMIVPRIRWWYELGTYAKLHQENVAKHCSRS